VGLATNSLTYYYRKKEELACACLLRSMAAVDALAAAAMAEGTVAGRVRAFIRAYLGMLADIATGRHPEMAVFNDVRALTPPHDAPVHAGYTDMFRSVRNLLRGADAPVLARQALNARAHLLLSIATWTRAWIFRYEPSDYERVGERIADVLNNGLARPGQHWDTTPETEPVLEALQGDPSDTREAFLRAATRLVNEHGYRGASVDRISAELNLTKGSFYHHHETKDELVSACFDRTFDAMRAVQTAAAAGPGSGWQRLMLGCRALVRYQMSDHGPLLRVSAWSALPDDMRREKLRTMNRLGERFAGFIVDGMADGSVRVVDPSVAAQMVSGMVNAAAELERWIGKTSADTAAELYARPLLEGLSPPR
jgi:AcrR family transcriptional regulator